MNMIKTASDYLDEANGSIDTISTNMAKGLNQEDVVYVDVRSKEAYDKGHINGAIHAERGMLEFYVDPSHDLTIKELQQNKTYVVYCEVGGQGALSTKLMQDMGMKKVSNLDGGYSEWKNQ